MNKQNMFEGIPLDRNDEKCPQCGGGRLSGAGFREARRIDEHRYQTLWNCDTCRGLVVMIDEDRDQRCPLCREDGVMTISQLKEVGTYVDAQVLYDIKELLEMGVDDAWKAEQYENWELINRLRKLVMLEPFSEEHFKECHDYWMNL